MKGINNEKQKNWVKIVGAIVPVLAICACVLVLNNPFNNMDTKGNVADGNVDSSAITEKQNVAEPALSANQPSVFQEESVSADNQSEPVFAEDVYKDDPASIQAAKEIAQEFKNYIHEEDSVQADVLRSDEFALPFQSSRSQNNLTSSNDDDLWYFINSNEVIIADYNLSNVCTPFDSSQSAPWGVSTNPNFKNIDAVYIYSQSGNFKPKSCKGWFGCIDDTQYGRTELSHIKTITGLNNLVLPEDASFMFAGCYALNSLTTENLPSGFEDVTKCDGMFAFTTAVDNDVYNAVANKLSSGDDDRIESASYAFANNSKLLDIDVSTWKFASQANINSMFYNSKNLKTIYKNGDWDWTTLRSDTPGVQAWRIFENCNSLEATSGDKTFKYSENKAAIDANASAYAHVYDGSNSGLFTLKSSSSYRIDSDLKNPYGYDLSEYGIGWYEGFMGMGEYHPEWNSVDLNLDEAGDWHYMVYMIGESSPAYGLPGIGMAALLLRQGAEPSIETFEADYFYYMSPAMASYCMPYVKFNNKMYNAFELNLDGEPYVDKGIISGNTLITGTLYGNDDTLVIYDKFYSKNYNKYYTTECIDNAENPVQYPLWLFDGKGSWPETRQKWYYKHCVTDARGNGYKKIIVYLGSEENFNTDSADYKITYTAVNGKLFTSPTFTWIEDTKVTRTVDSITEVVSYTKSGLLSPSVGHFIDGTIIDEPFDVNIYASDFSSDDLEVYKFKNTRNAVEWLTELGHPENPLVELKNVPSGVTWSQLAEMPEYQDKFSISEESGFPCITLNLEGENFEFYFIKDTAEKLNEFNSEDLFNEFLLSHVCYPDDIVVESNSATSEIYGIFGIVE